MATTESTYLSGNNPLTPPAMGFNPLSGPPRTSSCPTTLTHSELDKLESAIHDPVFRQLLCDYANEIQDPENKAKYEADIVALDSEKGIKCTFLHPSPGYVIKTSKASTCCKVFINVCSDPNVAKPASKRVESGSQRGVCWSIPYYQSQPHEERDNCGKDCVVYDVIFNPEAFNMACDNPQFKRLLNDTSLDAVEKAFDVKLDRHNLKFPKLKFKGSFRPTVIRESLNKDNAMTALPPPPSEAAVKPAPCYTIKYKDSDKDLQPSSQYVTDPCRPTHLVVEISMPGLTSAKGVDLDVLEHHLTLDCDLPKPYHLDLKLPYPVFEEDGVAKFDKSNGTLKVTLPVKPAPQVLSAAPVSRLISTDSGIGLEYDEYANTPTTTDAPKEKPVEKNFILPPYTCNIYEDFMVFKLDVKNVDPESLTKSALKTDEGSGFSLSFVNVGAGMVPFNYKFQMVLVIGDNEADILNETEIDVWDKNIIVQFALPKKGDCKAYKVGSSLDQMKECALPQLKEFRRKRDQMNKRNDVKGLKNVTNIDGKNTAPVMTQDEPEEDSSDEKERHSSGESIDSALSMSLAVAQDTQEVRGILKHRCVRRCFSESQAESLRWSNDANSNCDSVPEEDEEESGCKKTVRFNEVVKRQVFRQNASILGQKNKNLKKAEQKLRKAKRMNDKLERRASEGDAIGMMAADGFKISASFESSFNKHADDDEDDDQVEEEHDSGVASSYEDHQQHHQKVKTQGRSGPKSKRKGKKSKQQPGEMIFDLDV